MNQAKHFVEMKERACLLGKREWSTLMQGGSGGLELKHKIQDPAIMGCP